MKQREDWIGYHRMEYFEGLFEQKGLTEADLKQITLVISNRSSLHCTVNCNRMIFGIISVGGLILDLYLNPILPSFNLLNYAVAVISIWNKSLFFLRR